VNSKGRDDSSIVTTQRYAKISDDMVRREVEGCWMNSSGSEVAVRRRRWPRIVASVYVLIGLLLSPLIRFRYEGDGPVRWLAMSALWPVEVGIWVKGGATIDFHKRG